MADITTDKPYRVDYHYAYYDSSHKGWYEDLYNSQPFSTEAEARAYMNAVLKHAAAKTTTVELYRLSIIFYDEKLWHECGDLKEIYHLDF